MPSDFTGGDLEPARKSSGPTTNDSGVEQFWRFGLITRRGIVTLPRFKDTTLTWFEVLRLATQLIAVITPIIGQALRHGGEEVDTHVFPDVVKQKVVELAEKVEAGGNH